MLLTIDIGNTATKFAVHDGGRISGKHRIETSHGASAEEILKSLADLGSADLRGVSVSSVVRELRGTYEELGRTLTGNPTLFADHQSELAFEINYDPPEDCGPDRLVAAHAAVKALGSPVIVCDFGTATTIDLVDASLEYRGGIIAPGIETMARSLSSNTSRLPDVSVGAAHRVIGNSTARSIRSGIYFGYIGLADGIISRIQAQLDSPARVIATGGYAELISTESEFVELVEPDLIHKGLLDIWKIEREQ